MPSVRWPCSGAFARARSCHFQKNMPLEKPKWCVEDDEEMIEKARYLRPVAGRATTCRKAKCLFSVPPARGSSCAEFFADAKNQDDSPCGLQLDAEFSNPNPGSEAFHCGQARPDARVRAASARAVRWRRGGRPVSSRPRLAHVWPGIHGRRRFRSALAGCPGRWLYA